MNFDLNQLLSMVRTHPVWAIAALGAVYLLANHSDKLGPIVKHVLTLLKHSLNPTTQDQANQASLDVEEHFVILKQEAALLPQSTRNTTLDHLDAAEAGFIVDEEVEDEQ